MADTVNILDDGATAETLLGVLASVRAGDFSARMPMNWTGVPGKVADSINELVIINQALESELARISAAVGAQGRLTEPREGRVPGVQEHGERDGRAVTGKVVKGERR